MKALSIKEPYATMILKGYKTIETRRWKTNYRGIIMLCASKRPDSDISGKAFATAILYDIKPMVKKHEKLACCEKYKGAYSWFLKDISPIVPISIKGQLGLFDLNIEFKLVKGG